MTQETEERTRRDEELAREGWEKKLTATEPRLTEFVQMYEELGFEVRQESVLPEDLGGRGCHACFIAAADLYRTVYTRRK